MSAATAELAGRSRSSPAAPSGLGRGMVELFVAGGREVVIADVDAEAGEALAARARRRGRLPARPTSPTPTRSRRWSTSPSSTSVASHVMFNNAGHRGFVPAASSTTTSRDFDRVMARQPLRRHGRQPARGAAHGRARRRFDHQHHVDRRRSTPGAGLIAYRASKAAVIQFSRSIAVDLAEHGIRVNCIAPAHIATAINATLRPSVDRPADAAAAAPGHARATSPTPSLFLASDRAAQITGIVLPVDGGTDRRAAASAPSVRSHAPERAASPDRREGRQMRLTSSSAAGPSSTAPARPAESPTWRSPTA